MVHSLNITNYHNLILIGVEKNNDDARWVLGRKSNNWDRPADGLQKEVRLDMDSVWTLRSQERSLGHIRRKQKNTDIKESQSKRRRISTEN